MNRQANARSMEEIPLVGCERHLTQEKVGRVGLIVDGHPEIYPVNYLYENGCIFVRTGAGTRLGSLADGTTVSLEIDEILDRYRAGWSVLVVAILHRVTGLAEIGRLEELGLEPWMPGTRDRWVRLDSQQITGRRIRQ